MICCYCFISYNEVKDSFKNRKYDMSRPQKRNSKRSKTEQTTEAGEIRELAKCIIQHSNTTLETLDDPFDRYAHELKMRWHQDLKSFSSRLVKGYEVLVEQLSSENSSEKK